MVLANLDPAAYPLLDALDWRLTVVELRTLQRCRPRGARRAARQDRITAGLARAGYDAGGGAILG